jgi:hypothetical protein
MVPAVDKNNPSISKSAKRPIPRDPRYKLEKPVLDGFALVMKRFSLIDAKSKLDPLTAE